MSSNPSRPQIPSDMNAFNQKLIEEFRANHGQLSGQMAKSQVLLLSTTGARSGLPRTVVVGYRPDGNRYLAIASNNGNDVAPAWYFNLQKNPNATVEVGPDRFQVRAKTAGPDERPMLAAKVEYLERQQALTAREIPIVILEKT
jgi:deazaflavin-dependent oxidoreductase (nitroreductase family)